MLPAAQHPSVHFHAGGNGLRALFEPEGVLIKRRAGELGVALDS
jgi:hypothetical protein